MNFDRRAWMKVAAASGAAGLLAQADTASASARGPRPDAVGVLVDTTLCAGCRACEAACGEANGLPPPEKPGEETVFASLRKTAPDAFTVVNRATEKSPSGESRYAKAQCLHCVEPACASGCVVKALEKTANGPVVYHRERCLGCRYCMVVCPFGVPKYEYDKALPYVRKCTFCVERQAKGLPPACTEVCPTGALTFGKRADLLMEARRRVYGSPGRYIPEIFGEEEAGGTSWLYISDVPFASLGLPANVEKRSYPEMASGALSVVPFVVTLWPPLLMGLYTFSKRRSEVSKAEPGAGHREEGRHE